jgi:hypothetical protein
VGERGGAPDYTTYDWEDGRRPAARRDEFIATPAPVVHPARHPAAALRSPAAARRALTCKNIFFRDRNRCQYCARVSDQRLNPDHVVRCRARQPTWQRGPLLRPLQQPRGMLPLAGMHLIKLPAAALGSFVKLIISHSRHESGRTSWTSPLEHRAH